jgi:hypothetical protein
MKSPQSAMSLALCEIYSITAHIDKQQMKPAAEFILLADFAPMTFLNGVIWQSALVGHENSMNICCACIVTMRTATFFHLKMHIRDIIHMVLGDPSRALSAVFHMASA